IEGESPELQDIHRTAQTRRVDFCGIVRGYDREREWLEIEQRANFGPGEALQLMLADGRILDLDLEVLYDEKGNTLDRARHAKQRVYVSFPQEIASGSILRRVIR
ncbi:MAG TPA: U32 family peptidase C-terminal domain-containing protein, partial [Syntrophomonas sp.]|nr:U32 family peptidase C-terminal domain-containing protein [Syntrophomonas sp.]